MENLMYVVPVVSVLALLFAGYLAVKSCEAGRRNRENERDRICDQ